MFRRYKSLLGPTPPAVAPVAVEVPQPPPDYLTMPFPQLREIKDQVDAAIVARVEEARASFAAQLEMFGLSLDDVKPVKKKRITKVKYRDPDNPENTWSGVGKRKKWLQDNLDAGRSIEEFVVE